MKETLSKTQFISRFRDIRPENFSGPALSALFDYLEEMEEDIGEEMEFDPIAICCDFGEYTEKELRREYPELCEGCEDLLDIEHELADETIFMHVSQWGDMEDTVVLQSF